jgi:hypothetical protein
MGAISPCCLEPPPEKQQVDVQDKVDPVKAISQNETEEAVFRDEPQQEVSGRARKPTGLFALELEFKNASGETEMFEFENNPLGIGFSQVLPITVKRVEGDAEEMGVKNGMLLTKIGGVPVSELSSQEILTKLHEAQAELPPSADIEVEHIKSRKMSEHTTMTPTMTTRKTEKYMFQEDIYITGPWPPQKWAPTGGACKPEALLEPMPSSSQSVAMLRIGVKLTSQSFTFQVITQERKWDWHLYPRDAKPIKIGFISSHVSKEGLLKAGEKDFAVVGLGDQKLGHGINFHVVEPPGTTVTIWVEVPAKPSGDGKTLKLRTDTAEGARIWYTVEDTGVQLVAGDGINLERYRKYLPADIKLG